MDIGLTLLTHGVMTRDHDGDCFLQNISPEDMAPVESAVRAEALGFHSVWFSDHVVTERVTGEGEHPANLSGKRAYPERPVMLDIPTTIGAIASRTTTLRFSPSVYIAPYRHPLITAHEFATLDVLSGGRVILSVGVGWEKGEFAAMGTAFERRGAITDECIQIYKLAWTEPWIDFHGNFFEIENVSMDPKPVQKPHPPIWYGGVTPIAAKRAARRCDGFYPMYLDAVTRPETFDPLREEIAREGERIGRDLSGFKLGGRALPQSAWCALAAAGNRRVISALVATVVPCENSVTSARSTSAAPTPSMTPCIGSRGVLGTFATRTAALSSSSTNTSVKVPPTSTATRSLGTGLPSLDLRVGTPAGAFHGAARARPV